MQPLYTVAEFKAAKYTDRLPLNCKHCLRTFLRTKRRIAVIIVEGRSGDFCSSKCCNQHHGNNPPLEVLCDQCGKSFKKKHSHIVVTKHNFCRQSCASKYSNAHKTKGTCVSKLEVWLSKKLPILYPTIEFHFNRKDAINSELDIFIPSLKLAFELNGPTHYEPIFGSEKLSSVQTNDHRKMLACAERGIELCVIDVSHQKYFKEHTSMIFLSFITDLINFKQSS